jgi:cysteine desulfurase/selenocysteine lyase
MPNPTPVPDSQTSALDLELIREDTPALQGWNFFNNAGTSLSPRPVAQAMVDYQHCELENGPHRAADEYAQTLSNINEVAAGMLDAEGGIEFFDSVSRAHALCLQALDLKSGDRLLVAEDEWGGIIPQVTRYAQRIGARVERIPSQAGQVDVASVQALLDERVKLISLPGLPAVGGTPNPIAAIAALERPEACQIFVDAAQVWGQMPVSVADTGCDVLICTARKWLRGPRGISIAALSSKARQQIEQQGWLSGRQSSHGVASDFTRLLRIGLGAAMNYALDQDIQIIQQRILNLAARVQSGIKSMPHLTLLFDTTPECGMVSFSAGGHETALNQHLAERDVAIGQLKAVYHPGLFARYGLDQVLRISTQYYNLESEVDYLLENLQSWRAPV